MLHGGFLKKFEKLSKIKNSKIILWGIGINEHELNKQYFPAFLNRFKLVGLRDWGNPWVYIPCISCMHEAFNIIRGAITNIVVFEHYDSSIPIELKYKRNNRQNKGETLTDIINFLSQGEIVITNSYHGVYWSLLMNRKVLIWEPFSNRFYGFKPEVIYCDRNDWQNKLKMAKRAYSNYLNECRSINKEFYKKVSDILN